MEKLTKNKGLNLIIMSVFAFSTLLSGVFFATQAKAFVPAPVPAPCPDFNGDDLVNLSDFAFYGQTHNSVSGDLNFDPRADFDQDGDVDDDDFTIFKLYYNGPFTCGLTPLIDLDSICPDFNQDYVVNLSDFAYFGMCHGSSTGDPNYNAQADFDQDGDVDDDDLSLFEMYYNEAFTCAEYPTNEEEKSGLENKEEEDDTKEIEVPEVVVAPEPEPEPELFPELTVTKSVESGTYYPGDSVNFVVTVKNEGTGTAENVRIADTMPLGFTYEDGSGGAWFYGDLKAGKEMNHIYSVAVSTDVDPGKYINTVQVSADNHDPVKANATFEIQEKKGVVLGAEDVAEVENEEELPAAGSNLPNYLFWLISFPWLAFGAYGYQKIRVIKRVR